MSSCATRPKTHITTTSQPTSQTSDNSINISFPLQPGNSCESRTDAITIQPQPIRLEVDTHTDWPAIAATSFVGLAGAFVAFAVGCMAYLGQRNNVRATKANFRHEWQKEIKSSIARLISLAHMFHYEIRKNPQYMSSTESHKLLCELLENHSRIELMLDRSKSYTKEIIRTIELLVEAVLKQKSDDITKHCNILLDVANDVIEQTWQDIRNDLEGKVKK